MVMGCLTGCDIDDSLFPFLNWPSLVVFQVAAVLSYVIFERWGLCQVRAAGPPEITNLC